MKQRYERVEDILYNYRESKCEIKNIEVELKYLKDDYTGVAPIGYTEKTSSSNSFSSIVENESLHREEKEYRLNKSLSEKYIDIIKLENALEVLSDVERIVIEEYYFNKSQWWQVAAQVLCSEKWCRKIRKDAIKTISNCMMW